MVHKSMWTFVVTQKCTEHSVGKYDGIIVY